jgi:metallophosphoesterase superfamily enzyme
MLLAGMHLLPDPSGALVWPRQRLLALSDPLVDCDPRQATQMAGEVVRRLAGLLRQRRPASVVWLGDTLPALLAGGGLARRDATELAAMVAAQEWVWVAESLPAGLPGRAVPELAVAPLVFRHAAQTAAAVLGEVSASPFPVARSNGQIWPCFVIDGRRLVIPAFGLRPGGGTPGGTPGGTNVLSPVFRPLFRRPFQALMLAGGRIVTRPRARLEADDG